MSKIRQAPTISIRSLVLWALLAPVHGVVFAQGDSVELPENASEKSYGGGWECNYGYRAIGGICVAIQVPANGYLVDSSSGRGWKCDRGYRAVKEACVIVNVAENAHLNSSGSDWECNRPYRKKQGKCTLP